MFRKMLRAKIHHATVTQADLDYVGSITIDEDLLRASGLRPNEAVQVLDLDNGARLETYVFRGEPGSGVIGINGAAAHLVKVGHRVIIVCYGHLTEEQLDDHVATVVVVDQDNRVAKVLHHDSRLDQPAATVQ